MAVTLEISSNAGKWSDEFEKKIERQVPFATSVALNNTLTKTRDNEVWRSYERAFTARNKPFFKQVAHVHRSNRSQARTYGAVIGSVQEKMVPPPPGVRSGTGGRVADTSFMRSHVSGGVKVPRGSKIAVPMSGKVKRKAGGAVRKVDKPRSITSGKKGFRAGKYIMRRRNKKEIEPIYHLQARARINRAWSPMSAVKRGLDARMRHEFAAAWIRTIKTMR